MVTRPETKQAIADLCGEAGYVEAGFAPFISGAPVIDWRENALLLT